MGLSEKYINFINHPTVEATINFIKKFKSSKSYWSVSYFILLFTIREAIAWKFGSAIKTFCETQAVDSSFSMLWSVLGFVFDVGGSIELVLLGTLIFILLSLVKVAESEGTSVSVRENYLTLFLIVVVGVVFFYQNNDKKRILKEMKQENNETQDLVKKNNEILKKVEQDNIVNEYLIKDSTEKTKKFNRLVKVLQKMVGDDEEELDKVKELFDEEGLDKAILYLEVSLRKLNSKVLTAGHGTIKLKNIDEVHNNGSRKLESIDEINNSIIIDGLVYENIPFIRKYSWDEANMYCQEKDGIWRLPTRTELDKISNRKALEASNGEVLFVRKEFLENMKNTFFYWTNELRNDKFVGIVSFSKSATYVSYRMSRHSVLCVREE